ncbi:TPA: hypothetical protein ACH3X1_004375 [Trebouxia sp. C0004]
MFCCRAFTGSMLIHTYLSLMRSSCSCTAWASHKAELLYPLSGLRSFTFAVQVLRPAFCKQDKWFCCGSLSGLVVSPESSGTS